VPNATTGVGIIGGTHGNGAVEVIFDATIVAPEASYDDKARACAVSCHDRGGARARPAWTETTPMRCADCHASPPAQHFPGACTSCHREPDSTGGALARGPLHMNGRVDLGDGSGQCGACHGRGESPWPASGAHAKHENPTLTTPVDCASCHVVPSSIFAPGHLDGVVRVAFSGRAVDRDSIPRWDQGACAGVACHGANLVDAPPVVPAWTDTSGAASACGACHGIPPSQHTTSTSCDRSTCHGSEIDRASGAPTISSTGRSLHIDGRVDP
jgi:predicted CxxxxCH...CXXCH cytochrome family protein